MLKAVAQVDRDGEEISDFLESDAGEGYRIVA